MQPWQTCKEKQQWTLHWRNPSKRFKRWLQILPRLGVADQQAIMKHQLAIINWPQLERREKRKVHLKEVKTAVADHIKIASKRYLQFLPFFSLSLSLSLCFSLPPIFPFIPPSPSLSFLEKRNFWLNYFFSSFFPLSPINIITKHSLTESQESFPLPLLSFSSILLPLSSLFPLTFSSYHLFFSISYYHHFPTIITRQVSFSSFSLSLSFFFFFFLSFFFFFFLTQVKSSLDGDLEETCLQDLTLSLPLLILGAIRYLTLDTRVHLLSYRMKRDREREREDKKKGKGRRERL